MPLTPRWQIEFSENLKNFPHLEHRPLDPHQNNRINTDWSRCDFHLPARWMMAITMAVFRWWWCVCHGDRLWQTGQAASGGGTGTGNTLKRYRFVSLHNAFIAQREQCCIFKCPLNCTQTQSHNAKSAPRTCELHRSSRHENILSFIISHD